MAKLYIKQKNILVAFYNRTESTTVDGQVMSDLEKVRDCETLWQDANRFLGDYRSQLMYGRKTPQELKVWVREA